MVYPVCLDIRGRLCVVVGGGNVAQRKVQALLAAGARVRLISPGLTGGLAGLAATESIEWRNRKFREDDLEGALLVFAATDDRRIQQLICSRAARNGQLVNVADDPGRCNFHVPAFFQRGSLTIAVSTGGASPAVAAMIRNKLAGEFGAEYEVLLDIMAMIRQRLRDGDDSQVERKKIYKKILHDDIVEWIRSGRREALRLHLAGVLGPGSGHDIDQIVSRI